MRNGLPVRFDFLAKNRSFFSRSKVRRSILLVSGLAVLWPAAFCSASEMSAADYSWRSTEGTAVSEGLVVHGDYLYHLVDRQPSQIEKIRLSDLERTDTLILPARGAESIVKDAHYLYVGSFRPPVSVISIRISDFKIASVLNLKDAEGDISGMHLAGDFLYAGTTNQYLLKIDKRDPERLKMIANLYYEIATHFTKDNRIYRLRGYLEEMDNDDRFLYVPVDRKIPALLLRVSLDHFQKAGSIQLRENEDNAQKVIVRGRYMYVLCNSAPAKIVRIGLGGQSKLHTFTMAAGEDSAKDMVCSGNALFVLLRTKPHKLVKINIPNFDGKTVVNFSDGIESGIEAIDVDEGRKNLYLAFDVSVKKARIWEIPLADLSGEATGGGRMV